MKLESLLEDLNKREVSIHKMIDKRNQKRKIKCKSCDNMHEIGSLEVIQTHWYTEPYGCTSGDYWSAGELQFICPDTKVRNRLLFFNYDVIYDKRHDYDYDPDAQFKRMYKHLFKKVIDTYDKDSDNNWVICEYVDKHRKRFGLVVKTD